MRNEDLKQEA